MTATVRVAGQLLPVCSTFRFDINSSEGWPPLIVGTGGPGLGWTFALNEAVRRHCQRRGDVLWREIRGEVVDELPLTGRRHAIAHVQVKTSRHVDPIPAVRGKGREGMPDLLDIWVRRVKTSDETGVEADEGTGT